MNPMSDSNELNKYQQATQALQAAGLTTDQFVKMYRSQSSHHASTHKLHKRKSIEPRSVSTSNYEPTQCLSHHDIAQGTADMNRQYGISVQSAPAAVPLSRGASRSSMHNRSTHMPPWQEHPVEYGASSRFIDGTLQDPADFVANVPDFTIQTQPNYTTAIPEQQVFDPALLSATSTHHPWSAASNSSMNSPRYSMDFTDASSMSPVTMSRDPTRSSFSSHFADPSLTEHLAMLRMQSEASHMSRSESHSHHPTPIGAVHPSQPPFVHDPNYPSPYSHHASLESPSTLNFAAPSDEHSYVAPVMNRSASSHSSASSSSSNPLSRPKRRHLETIHQSKRSLAPAVDQPSSSSSRKRELKHEHQNVKMERVKSENGEERLVAAIPREPERPKRPAQLKLFCVECNDHPEGFRGEHELQRHALRAHAKVRKVWVCVDNSPDKKFLANCKACRTGKRYGAYYNAAAHLRRTHFNPRKRGRRSKGVEYEKRGGKGGGDWPPMNELKQHWMREREETVEEDTPSLPDDADADAVGEPDFESPDETNDLDYASLIPLDAAAVSFTGSNFDAHQSPMSSFPPATFTTDMNLHAMPHMTFDDMVNPCAGEVMSQAAGLYGHHNMFGGEHFLPPQPTVAFDVPMGGQTWAAQS